jgi:hypothetical protein
MSEQEEWSRDIAILAADALRDAKVLQGADIERAIDIIAEEIFVRLTLGDYPPRDSQSID